MYILHIETATRICSVALSRNGELVRFHDRDEGLIHSAQLAPMIKTLLEQCDVRPSELHAVSVSSGPGSYTGLRVGSSTAKGMAYSLGIPLLGIPTLLSLAYAAFEKHSIDLAIPMLDARRNEVYVAAYDKAYREITAPSSLIVEDSNAALLEYPYEKKLACGDGAHKLELIDMGLGIGIDRQLLCSARHLIRPALDYLEGGFTSDPMYFTPFYLKPPHITVPNKGV